MDEKTKADLGAMAKEMDAADKAVSDALKGLEEMDSARLLRLYPQGYQGRLVCLESVAAAAVRLRTMQADVLASLSPKEGADGTPRR